jgi:hypothetical protein
MQAQQKSNTIVGVYYLTGVRETTSGFKLNADSTFDFFFSYGALDRSGKGTWRKEGSKLILNSKPLTKGFALISSKVADDENYTIRITEENLIFRSHVYSKIKQGQIETQGLTDQNGMIVFPKQRVDSIILLLEFCPDKFFSYVNTNKDHNLFEFRFEKDMMDVFFEGLIFSFTEDGFEGQHPLLKPGTCHFKKN